jgi:hypothetical protein
MTLSGVNGQGIIKNGLSKCYLVAELQPFEKSLFSATAR